MQETEVRKALQAYVTDSEPAMRLDAGTVLAAGRRSRRTRRLAAFTGAGLAVALLGAGVAVVSRDSGGPDFAPASPCAGPPGPRPDGEYAADRALSPDLTAWAANSLTCFLSAEIPRLLPTARFAQVPGAESAPLTAFSHGGEPPFGNRVDSLTLIRDGQGTGDLTVMVGVVERSYAAKAKDSCEKETIAPCIVQAGPNGETVLLGTEVSTMPADEPRNFVVRVYRGQSEIYVQASNTDTVAVDNGPPKATRPTPILSADQAVELALSPELYLFP